MAAVPRAGGSHLRAAPHRRAGRDPRSHRGDGAAAERGRGRGRRPAPAPGRPAYARRKLPPPRGSKSSRRPRSPPGCMFLGLVERVQAGVRRRRRPHDLRGRGSGDGERARSRRHRGPGLLLRARGGRSRARAARAADRHPGGGRRAPAVRDERGGRARDVLLGRDRVPELRGAGAGAHARVRDRARLRRAPGDRPRARAGARGIPDDRDERASGDGGP